MVKLHKLVPNKEIICGSQNGAPTYLYFDVVGRIGTILVEAWTINDSSDPNFYISKHPLDPETKQNVVCLRE